MATYRKRGSTWRAEVAKKGMRLSATFETKAEAVAWATEKEAELGRSGPTTSVANNKTFADALRRYELEVSPAKKGERWEKLRLAAFLSLEWAGERIGRIVPDQIAQWRDRRLKTVKASTVNRELNLMSAVFEQARREWKWLAVNPVRDVKRPTNPRPRDRRITTAEEDKMLEHLGYERGQVPMKLQQHLAAAFLFALETGMRQGEIIRLSWDRVFLKDRYVRLEDTKNGDKRNVPLSSAAVRLLELQPKFIGEPRCFPIESASADALWRKARSKAKIANLKFHDSRHEAITRLAKKLDVLDLARMIGHRDPRSLMIYYNATATELACRLD
ncbi:site-specific integrase [Trinickia symbiotica]|uniref:Site-specific integrase n=1 Tax=Trinickia symbiotica TaxID=863227 RepID=A0A2T3XSR6_9BURK|nr:site-specific integrase [Trinickia symbiotica]PTB19573.1 site-specific integrase [Trinickia symbiotica]